MDSTELYRRVLAAQPDRSVVVIAIGPLRALAKLLSSAPDAITPLSGRDLVAHKVFLLSCMGGYYPSVPKGTGAEWNFQQDAKAARGVVERWPTPILFSDAQLGNGIMTGRRLATDMPDYHPVTLAYAIFPDCGFAGDRPSWDQTSILCVVRDVKKYWDLTKSGHNRIGPKGENKFDELEDRGHRYLLKKVPVAPIEDVIEDLMVSAREGPQAFDFDIATYCKDGVGRAEARDATSRERGAARAFDRDRLTTWEAGAPGSWIQYQLPDGRKAVASHCAIHSTDARSNQQMEWDLLASNDAGATWTKLDHREHENPGDDGTLPAFTCANTRPFNLFRVRFGGADPVRIGSIELLERIENTAGVHASALRLDQSHITLAANQRAAVNVTIEPFNALDKQVEWSSSDEHIARIRRISRNTAMVCGVAPIMPLPSMAVRSSSQTLANAYSAFDGRRVILT